MTDNDQFFGEGWKNRMCDVIPPVAGANPVVVKTPIFDSCIIVEPFIKDYLSSFSDKGWRAVPLIVPQERGYRITFSCRGLATDAFIKEFLQLVEEYNHFEILELPKPKPEKKSAWRKFAEWCGKKERQGRTQKLKEEIENAN